MILGLCIYMYVHVCVCVFIYYYEYYFYMVAFIVFIETTYLGFLLQNPCDRQAICITTHVRIHIVFSSILWHGRFILDDIVWNEWDRHSFLNQQENTVSGGHNSWSLHVVIIVV